MTTRSVSAIQVKLQYTQWLSVIVWPADGDKEEHCCRLINSKRTWMTCRAGDAVLLRKWKTTEWKRYFIERVELYLVFPVAFNGTIVETAQGWLDGHE